MWTYIIQLFSFKKRASKEPLNIRIMHHINRIAIIVFLIGIVILVFRLTR